MRYFFHIGYQGTHYNGWQKLPNANSVQAVIENLLAQTLKRSVSIVGCGRTDTGVHASQFFFHLDVDAPLHPEMLFRMNKNLPSDIAVFDILLMEGEPHARMGATRRDYNYFIHTHKDPFLNDISSLYQKTFDVGKMKEAASLLTQYDDYKAFCKNVAQYRTTICKVTAADLFVNTTGDMIRFQISANRFLGSMVRIIVHKLIEAGTGKLSVEEFEKFFITGVGPEIIRPARPQGLHLSRVVYPFLDIPARSEFLITLGKWERV
jgi:tRNA pseudouridine38-40 synthase